MCMHNCSHRHVSLTTSRVVHDAEFGDPAFELVVVPTNSWFDIGWLFHLCHQSQVMEQANQFVSFFVT